MIILYFVLVVILLFLFLLFGVATSIQIHLTPLSFRVSLFHIPVFYVKEKRMYRLLLTAIEKSLAKEEHTEIAYLPLKDYIHIDKLILFIDDTERKDIKVIRRILNAFLTQIDSCIRIQKETKNRDFALFISFHFFVGTFFLNYLHIRKEIRHGQTRV